MTPIKFCIWSSALVAALAAAPLRAANPVTPEAFQVQGFAALSLIGSSNYNFFGDTRDSADTRFSEFGLNAQWQMLPSLRLSGQALHRRAGESDEQGLRVDYAQADWVFLNQPTTRVGLKFGKPKIPFGLYNETRDVPMTRPGVLLPQSIYLDGIRDFVLAAPGAYLHGTHLGAYGAFEFNLGWVRPDFGSPLLRANLLGNVTGKLTGGALSASARWEPTPDTTLALSYVDLSADYQPSPRDRLLAGTLDVSNLIVSLQQRIDTLTLTAEFRSPRTRSRDFRLKGFGVLPDLVVPDLVRTGQAAYLQGEWRFSPAWEAMLRYDVLYNNKDDRNGKQFEAAGAGRHGFTQFAKDWTLGLRWDVSAHWMLRTEYHHVYGTMWLPPADNPGPATEARWNMWLLQGAYRF